jgi:putative DNA primase/helicase
VTWSDARDALEACARAVALAAPERRLDELFSCAKSISPSVREGWLSKQDVVDRLQGAAEAYGLIEDWGDDLITSTIAAGLSQNNGSDFPSIVPSKGAPKLEPYELHAFLDLNIKPREMVLAPIIPEKALAMLYAIRGTGKTHVGLGCAYAVATGGKFLRWHAPKARRVLCVDGEMAAIELQDRLRCIVAAANVKPAPGLFNMLPGDLVEGGIGNLATPEAQKALEPWLHGVEFLVLDNLSCLTFVMRDNDAESWTPIQEWLLGLRRRGVSVLIIHHAGKGGQQRGTSRREDVLDTSVSLRRPTDYKATEGARFEVHIEKGRGIHGEACKPFEARYEERNGAAEWTLREIEDVERARVAALLDDGLSLRDIESETGISKSKVQRLKTEIEAAKAHERRP